jgi:hypothetical protein
MYSFHNGKLLCRKDYEKIRLPVCGKCGLKIGQANNKKETIRYVAMQEQSYHLECFACDVS